MLKFEFEQRVQQLEKRKGGYYYLLIDAGVVDQFPKKRATRLKCVLEKEVVYSCGLNHYGDGNYFVIVATKYIKKLGKKIGDPIHFEIYEDPNPLGVDVPEVLRVLLEQDPAAKKIYEALSDGKKRSLIYLIQPIKDIDKKVGKALAFLAEQAAKQN